MGVAWLNARSVDVSRADIWRRYKVWRSSYALWNVCYSVLVCCRETRPFVWLVTRMEKSTDEGRARVWRRRVSWGDDEREKQKPQTLIVRRNCLIARPHHRNSSGKMQLRLYAQRVNKRWKWNLICSNMKNQQKWIQMKIMTTHHKLYLCVVHKTESGTVALCYYTPRAIRIA